MPTGTTVIIGKDIPAPLSFGSVAEGLRGLTAVRERGTIGLAIKSKKTVKFTLSIAPYTRGLGPQTFYIFACFQNGWDHIYPWFPFRLLIRSE